MLITTPFEHCHLVGRDYATLTTRHSLYAVRHRTVGLLYVGKPQNPKQRFTGEHKALVWCWWTQLSLDLEALIIRATQPPFNVKIPMRD
ncbi:MAG TPA: hypothetical protein V6D18_00140 [Thermosynechococcaceae cyanobacterium]